MKIHHVGYLVKNMDRALESFVVLGYEKETDVVLDPIRKIHVCFLVNGGQRIELVSPAGDDSVVAGLIKTYRNTPYHICYETEDFEKDAAYLENNKFTRFEEPTAAPAIGGRLACYFMSPRIGLVEIVEGEKE